MNNTRNISYPGILRAFNKIEEKEEFDNKNEILSSLSVLIDKIIQMHLECIRFHQETITKTICISDDEISNLLKRLEESNIVLYESISNEQALIQSKYYHVSKVQKTKSDQKRTKKHTSINNDDQ